MRGTHEKTYTHTHKVHVRACACGAIIPSALPPLACLVSATNSDYVTFAEIDIARFFLNNKLSLSHIICQRHSPHTATHTHTTHTYLMQNRPDELQRQRREFVLFEKIVQVLLEHLEHQTRVVLVLEALEGAHKIEFVRILLAETRQDGDLDLALARVRRMVLQDLDGNDVVGAALPAFDHLTEGAATEELEDLKSKSRTNN